MLTLEDCMKLAAPRLLECDEIWENDEVYFFDDIIGEWEENFGVVVFKKDGALMELWDYFHYTKVWGIMKNFWLLGYPHIYELPKGWDEEETERGLLFEASVSST